jgi:hypothetical protein
MNTATTGDLALVQRLADDVKPMIPHLWAGATIRDGVQIVVRAYCVKNCCRDKSEELEASVFEELQRRTAKRYPRINNSQPKEVWEPTFVALSGEAQAEAEERNNHFVVSLPTNYDQSGQGLLPL